MADVKYVYQIDAVDNTKKAFTSVNSSMKRTQAQASAMNGHFRQWRGMMGQMGHQIQDVAVQAQMGTNNMIIMAQQGGQIASLLGPYGAIAGALISIGGAAAMAAGAIGGSAKATKELAEAQAALNLIMSDSVLGETTEEYQELLNVSSSLAQMQLDFTLFKMAEAVESSKDALIEALGGSSAVLADIAIMQDNAGKAVDEFTEKNNQAALAFVQMQDSYKLSQQFGEEGKQLSQVLDDLFGAETSQQISDTIATLNGIKGTTKEFLEAKRAATEYALGLFNLLRQREKYEKGLKPAGTKEQQELEAELQKQLDAEQAIQEKRVKSAQDVIRDLINATQGEHAQLEFEYQRHVEKLDALLEEGLINETEHGRGVQAALVLKEQKVRELNLRLEEEAERHAESMKRKQESERAAFERQATTAQEYAQRIIQSQMTQMQQAFALHSEEESKLKEAFNKKLITQQTYEAASLASQQKYAKAQQDINTSALEHGVSFHEQALGTMSSALEEGTAAQKVAFALQKSMAIAQILLDTEKAAMAAGAYGATMGGLPGFLASASTIRAMGYASAGIVAGQTLASFEGGGITFNGIRAGGLDGKGGRLAVVHPNEKITDLEKEGEGQGVNVSFNIYAWDTATGAEQIQKQRGTIISMLNRAMNNQGQRGQFR